MSDHCGRVYLVGAGPGDPGLMTVRGLELLRRADVVVYDRLVAPEILVDAPAAAEKIAVGKTPKCHPVSQEQINELLVGRAKEGLMVVRLKGGDPFVFGRGFEEMTACREAGVECVVVPGVSSAIAVPAAAGIPITHRRTVRSMAIMTARFATDSTAPPLDYAALAKIDTVVILMGRAKLPEVARSLIEAGRSASIPAACIEWGTTPRQRVTVATLGTIAEAANRDGLNAPVVTVIGEVAACATDAARTAGSTCAVDAPAQTTI